MFDGWDGPSVCDCGTELGRSSSDHAQPYPHSASFGTLRGRLLARFRVRVRTLRGLVECLVLRGLVEGSWQFRDAPREEW